MRLIGLLIRVVSVAAAQPDDDTIATVIETALTSRSIGLGYSADILNQEPPVLGWDTLGWRTEAEWEDIKRNGFIPKIVGDIRNVLNGGSNWQNYSNPLNPRIQRFISVSGLEDIGQDLKRSPEWSVAVWRAIWSLLILGLFTRIRLNRSKKNFCLNSASSTPSSRCWSPRF